MKKILIITLLLIAYLLIPTKLSTQLDSQFGPTVYKVLSPATVYWRVQVLEDYEAFTGINIITYLAKNSYYREFEINRQKFYLAELKKVLGVLEDTHPILTLDEQNELLIESLLNSQIDTFKLLYKAFRKPKVDDVNHVFSNLGKKYELRKLLEEKYNMTIEELIID